MVTSVDLAVIWWFLDTRKNKEPMVPRAVQDGAHQAGSTCGGERKCRDRWDAYTPEAAELTGLRAGTPIINGGGDLTVAALGSGSIGDGELHISLGTSGWVAGHVSKRKIDLPHYTGCIGSTYPKKYFLVMAHQETAGICLEWLKNKVLYHEEQLKSRRLTCRIFTSCSIRWRNKRDPAPGD